MQITIQPIAPLAGGLVLTRQIEAFMHELLAGQRNELLEVGVRHGPGSDAETVDDDIHCDVRARLVSGERVNVSHAAPTLVKSLHGAITKLRESIDQDRELAPIR